MKPFEAPERSVETKVFLCVKNWKKFFLFAQDGIGAGGVKLTEIKLWMIWSGIYC